MGVAAGLGPLLPIPTGIGVPPLPAPTNPADAPLGGMPPPIGMPPPVLLGPDALPPLLP
jgi:hypothetical protein